MSYQNEDKVLQSAAPEMCIKCKEMYGHETFSNMCSKCFKLQKLESELLVKKNSGEQTVSKVVQDTLVEQTQKPQKVQIKQSPKLPRRETNQNIQNKSERERTREKQQKKPQNKCFTCTKKTGMLGYECSHCVNNFCKFHRLPQDHECTVDFISAGKKLLTAANPELKARKISGIDN